MVEPAGHEVTTHQQVRKTSNTFLQEIYWWIFQNKSPNFLVSRLCDDILMPTNSFRAAFELKLIKGFKVTHRCD